MEVVDGVLLAQTGGRLEGRVLQDLQHLLQLLLDMEVEELGSEYRGSGTAVTVKQSPVVEVPFLYLLHRITQISACAEICDPGAQNQF